MLPSEWRRKARQRLNLSKKSDFLYEILSRCRLHGQTLREQLLEAIRTGVASDSQKRRKMKWAFLLCPVLDYCPKHVLLTSTAIKELLKEWP